MPEIQHCSHLDGSPGPTLVSIHSLGSCRGGFTAEVSPNQGSVRVFLDVFPMSVFKTAVCPQQCSQGEADTSNLHQRHGEPSLTTHPDEVKCREHKHRQPELEDRKRQCLHTALLHVTPAIGMGRNAI